MKLPNFTRSLRFQIVTALLLILVLFTAAKTFTFFALQEQRDNQIILNLAAKLQLTEQHLTAQAMHYQQNTPYDKKTYTRDINLYYQDLMSHIDGFDMICDAFAQRQFQPRLTGLADALSPSLDQRTREAVKRLDRTWKRYRQDLIAALGPDETMPQLEAAADFITSNSKHLERAATMLQDEVQTLTNDHLNNINYINRLTLFSAILMVGVIIYWFYRNVINPLERAERGFRKVAQGDFGHQVQIQSDNEIARMTDSFNHLSTRLDGIFRLIDHVQQGSDLDATLGFVVEDFRRFLPLNWFGVLFLTGDGSSLKLERSFLNGVPDSSGRVNYLLKGTLLERTIQSGEPQHIRDMQSVASQSDHYVFLHELVSKGLRDAIFLPFAKQSPVPGVLVFASKTANTYTLQHLELLKNIAHLITHSFGRTAKLVEHAHLAAVGEFASGVAHEIRSPLATISIALDYFKKSELPESVRKRAELARLESERMARLLDDMLLYAKPLTLNMREVDLSLLLKHLLDTNQSLAAEKHQRLVFKCASDNTRIFGDPDRLVQIFLNLTKNSCEAAPDGSEINYRLEQSDAKDTLSISIHNQGDPIAPEVLPRIFEPFFTTKPTGTGLGLSIVKRMAVFHGGEISISSDQGLGTTTVVTFPVAVGLG